MNKLTTALKLSLCALTLGTVAAQGAQFFRIAGPTAAKITAFRPDGTLVWSNAQAGATYTIQTVASLPGGTNWVDYIQVSAASGVNTNLLIAFHPPAGMALIPAGSFTMGDTLDGESDAIPTVSVTVSAFYMDTNLVSLSQWQAVYNWATSHGYVFDNAGAGKAANHPVESLNWYDVVKWCNARSQQAGLTPVYYTDAGLTQIYTTGDTDAVYANWATNGYRLPTEAECQKAARGGLSGLRFPWGNTIDWNHANYFSQWTGAAPSYPYDLATTSGYDPAFTNGGAPYTSPVGSFAANGYGLYDMAGNVQVWCWDWYAAPPYPAGSPYLGGTDPRGPASSPDGYRVLHGGFFTYGLRCAKRSTNSPSFVIDHDGLRCVRGL